MYDVDADELVCWSCARFLLCNFMSARWSQPEHSVHHAVCVSECECATSE